MVITQKIPDTGAALHSLASGLPPILMLSVSDSIGAFSAAASLHLALTAAGAAVKTLVLIKTSGISGISAIPRGKNLFIINTCLTSAALRFYPDRPQVFEGFTLAGSPVRLEHMEIIRGAGIVHLHWISGMIDFPAAGAVFENKPLVWTLHDMNPFTGGCHYTAGCEKYTAAGCVNCPQLGPPSGYKDLAAENFAAKRDGYSSLNLTAVAPSRWLGDCVRASRLLGFFPREVVPNGIDTDVFSPRPRKEARAVLGLPPGRRMVLFSANGVNRRNKGYQVLLAALARLLPRWTDGPPPLLLTLGTPPREKPPGYECFLPGFIEDKAKLAAAYAAADVFVSPSFQEVFGLATAEAQACGTPGVGFYGTGAEDIVRDGVTGFLARHPGLPLAGNASPSGDDAYSSFSPDSVEDLAAKIKRVLDLPQDEYAVMRRACRERALAEYSSTLQAARYLQLYRRILGLPESLQALACEKYPPEKNRDSF